jgi:hypothetical protein
VGALLREKCVALSLPALIVESDFAADASWDLSSPTTAHFLNALSAEGDIDLVGGALPSGSFRGWSPGGGGAPRFRQCGEYAWGLPGLQDQAKKKLCNDNACLLHFVTLVEKVVSCGGAGFVLLRAADATDDYTQDAASMSVVEAFFERTRLDRLDLGPADVGRVRGAWLLGHNLDAMLRPLSLLRGGGSVRLPPGLCEALAVSSSLLLQRFAHQGSGPGGSGSPSVTRVSGYSRFPAEVPAGTAAIAVMNEECVRGRHVALGDTQGAVYLHVDDGVFVSLAAPPGAKSLAQTSMEMCAQALRDVGFDIVEETTGDNVKRVVGYEVVRSPPRLGMPTLKGLLLDSALRWLAGLRLVDVDVLHSLLSMWVWCALVRRELLSVPQALFRFIERHTGQCVVWWPSARRELMVIIRLLPLVYCDLSVPLCPVVFATDAMGANDADHGGWGLVSTRPSTDVLHRLFSAGCRPGMTVCRLDGDVSKMKNPDRAWASKIPFSRVPPRIVADDDEWTELARGRWRWPDHITIGEGRVVVMLLAALAAIPSAHRARILSLNDHMPWSAAMAKGRSPAVALNYLLRRRSAISLACQLYASLPWIDTARQLADGASRIQGW